jgi:hypothetical protein
MPLTRKDGFVPIGSKGNITDLMEMGKNKIVWITTQWR